MDALHKVAKGWYNPDIFQGEISSGNEGILHNLNIKMAKYTHVNGLEPCTAFFSTLHHYMYSLPAG